MKCDICNIDMRSLDTHHIVSKTYGGSNVKSNITKLCPNCHRKVHSGDIIIEGWFMTSIGRKLIWRENGINSIIGREDPKAFNMYGRKNERL